MLSARPNPPSPELADRLLAWAREAALDPALGRHLQLDPEARTWTRIDTPEDREAWLIGWPPGTRTGWHDHGGARGAFTVLRGALEELTPAAGRGPDLEGDIALPPGGPHRRELTAGEGRAFGPRHVHDVLNTGSVHAVSLHLYAPALPLMRRFEPYGGVLRLVEVERAGAWA
ncbi:hypothetical protein N566_14530 [Streptomycetaceae bacterium MP113-05]|nr:hypothetical protein N566_14530 [Streptomycetaceae bacterium MP113-05]